MGACAVIINQVLTTARRLIVCGRAARPHGYRPACSRGLVVPGLCGHVVGF